MGAGTDPPPEPDHERLGIMVVDPEPAMAEGLALRLLVEPTIGSTRAASSALEALHVIEQQTPKVLIVGAEPGTWQVGFLRQVAREHPGIGVVVMSETEAIEDLAVLIQAGAMGWVPKTASVEWLSRVVTGVGAGQWWLPRALLGHVVRQLSREAESAAMGRLNSLTFRERQVLAAMAEGMPRSEIATCLCLSVNTVRTHIQHLLVKLEVHTSLEAVSIALREGVGIAHPPHRARERGQAGRHLVS
ncbi:MAG: transcriptional regulator [Frankiales bacterium]|nr:transcriptional regulator [Frankiales bacterium]